ncbi:hypothetical protein BDZ91DRAFT_800818 [Kalaharituber pfeilii]|nr:hypothetical protein BDZ91DRAFT_800818 [Kalaharituber pfeilii]
MAAEMAAKIRAGMATKMHAEKAAKWQPKWLPKCVLKWLPKWLSKCILKWLLKWLPKWLLLGMIRGVRWLRKKAILEEEGKKTSSVVAYLETETKADKVKLGGRWLRTSVYETDRGRK